MRTTQERFWAKVDRSAGPEGCWLWTAPLTAGSSAKRGAGGYGRFRLGGRMVGAHCLALEWAVGPCPPGKEACHSCRNRHCVNPAHLRWDTKQANHADMVKDGTSIDNRGERHVSAKLTAKHVLEIRAAVVDGATQVSMADRYGVSQALVSQVVRGIGWKHLPRA